MKFWIPALLWMGIIFLFSARPSVDVSDSGVINFLFFKLLHVLEYAVLFVLNFRALKNTLRSLKPVRMLTVAFLLTVLYAITDEIHQTLVPTREGRPRDVIIDALGALIAWYLIVQLLPKAPKKLRSLGKTLRIL